MRILFLTSGFPYPPHSGAKVRQYHLIRELSREHEVYLLSFCSEAPARSARQALEPYVSDLHIVLQPRGVFRKALDAVSALFSNRPYISVANHSRELTRILGRLLERWQIDILQVDELYMAGNVLELNKRPTTVLHAYNVESELFAHISDEYSGFRKLFYSWEAKRLKTFEKHVARSVDCVVCVSENDRAFFQTCNPCVYLAPNGVPGVSEPRLRQTSSVEFLFVGTLSYPPNESAVHWLASEIFPSIRQQIPEARLSIVGRGAGAVTKRLCQGEGIHLLDDVEDISPLLSRASAMLVPLRAGGGSRIKILEAFSHRLPVISTAIGASGLEVTSNKELFLAETTAEFVDSATVTVSETTTRSRLTEAAVEYLQEKHLWHDIGAGLSTFYQSIVTDVPQAPASQTDRKQRLLLVIPHWTLLSPQGHRSRLDGFLRLVGEQFEISLLVPTQTPRGDLKSLEVEQVLFFDEPSYFGVAVPFFLGANRGFVQTVCSLVDEHHIDAVVFDFPWGCGALAKRLSVPSIYFSHGVESEFSSIVLADRGMDFFPLSFLFRSIIERIERSACVHAALVVTMSERDSGLLSELYLIPERRFYALPQPVEVDRTAYSREHLRQQFSLPPDCTIIVCHGSAAHLPNRKAFEYLVEDVAPELLTSHPEVRILLVGPGVSEQSHANVLQLGFVDDLSRLIAACDIAAVPIFEGSGVRMKLFDYLCLGIPLVTTKKGAEGLALRSGTHALISDNSKEGFLFQLKQAIENDSLRRALGENGKAYVREEHDPASLSMQLCNKLQLVTQGVQGSEFSGPWNRICERRATGVFR